MSRINYSPSEICGKIVIANWMMAGDRHHPCREKRYGKDAYFRDPENLGSTGGCYPRSGVRLFFSNLLPLPTVRLPRNRVSGTMSDDQDDN
ncbi:MAG: hypothetical protein AB4352_09240 [Hormoscilla sp.]